ncbi:MAG: hypothetical protein Q9222_006723, partial [Ikaeria aurantiellina]
MTANREERFLMRQRGAGTRDIELAFDLQLPGVSQLSRSPAKPQSPRKSRKTPQPEPTLLRSTRKTPKSAAIVPKSVSKNISATARGRKAKQGITQFEHTDEATIHVRKGSQVTSHDDEGNATKKRKTAASAQQSDNACSVATAPKTRRKRKSIGQQSVTKRSKRPSLSSKPAQLPDPNLDMQEVESAETKLGNDQSDEPLARLTEMSHETNLPRQSTSTVLDQGLKQTRRRKRKSITQGRRPTKKPRSAQETLDQDIMPQEGVNHTPMATHNTTLYGSIDDRVKPRARRQKKPPAVEQPIGKKNSPCKEPSIIVSQPIQDSRGEAAAVDPNVQPAKRGRKPRIPLEQRTKTLVEEVDSSRGPVENEVSNVGEPVVPNPEPEASNLSSTPNRKAKRRKRIVQVRRPKKQTTNRIATEMSLSKELIDPKTEDVTMAAAVVSPVPRRRGRPKKAPFPALEMGSASAVATKDNLEPALPVRKPRPVEQLSGPINNDAPRSLDGNAVETSKERRKPGPKKATKPAEPPILTTSRDEPPTVAASSNNVSSVPAPTIKKRGRPKKQPPQLLEPATVAQADHIPPMTQAQPKPQPIASAARYKSARTKPVRPSTQATSS